MRCPTSKLNCSVQKQGRFEVYDGDVPLSPPITDGAALMDQHATRTDLTRYKSLPASCCFLHWILKTVIYTSSLLSLLQKRSCSQMAFWDASYRLKWRLPHTKHQPWISNSVLKYIVYRKLHGYKVHIRILKCSEELILEYIKNGYSSSSASVSEWGWHHSNLANPVKAIDVRSSTNT